MDSSGGLLTLQRLAEVLGGAIFGGQVRCPGPNRGPQDRSLSVKLTNNEDGFVVNSFAGDDPIVCKDYVRDKAGLPPRKPNGKAHGGSSASSHGKEGQSRPHVASATQLQPKVFDPVNYVVPGYIAEGATILAGRPKLGKSWMMLDIGLAVARGGYCLGDAACDEGDVLYLALEDNERRLQSRITKLIGAFATQWPARFYYATEWPRSEEGGLEHIRNWVREQERPRLIVVDVLAAFRSSRKREDTLYEGDYAAVKGLQSIASEFGLAIVIVHHLRKGAAETDPFEKVSGTLGLSGAADTVLILDRDGEGATLYGRGRDIEEIETAVEFDPRACRWRILGSAAEVHRSDERSRVLKALKDAGDWMTPTDIADATRMSTQNVRQLLFSMVKAGSVTKLQRGRYVHPEIATGEEAANYAH